ncbi:amino acid ABC transporter permease [Treponema parvum]|uniref:amino acid ABC transporter permease n=1 Tax=Treponema parvum TaxID=138851 RepID=UPI001AEC2FFE|nr:amino acid ABC transporter permease [Treponema parvum]
MELNFPFLKNTFFAVLHGIPTALAITFFSLTLAAVPAFFMALARIYKIKLFSNLVKIYVSFIRGTPMVIQILIIYSLLPSLINRTILALGLPVSVFDIDPLFYAIVVFTLHSAAAFSEIIRSAILTVDRGQMDACLALGMKPLKAFRLVVIPQAAVNAVANVGNLTVNLFKETSLAFLMTVKDITAIAKIEASFGYNYIEAYLDIFAVYLVICSLFQFAFYLLEKKVFVRK